MLKYILILLLIDKQITLREIGSEFSLNPSILKESDKPWERFFPFKNKIFLSTGRDSLVYAIRAHKIEMMLVPSYFEDGVLTVLQNERIKIKFYKVNENLQIDLCDIEKQSRNADSLLIVHYFGFPQPIKQIKKFCESHRIILIEDCVQSMLSSDAAKPLGSFGQISFNSLRKFFGIPDGSVLTTTKKTLIQESKYHQNFVKKREEALIGKHYFLKNNPKYSRFYFKKAFIEPENMIHKYPKPAPMSKISLRIMKKIDYPQIIKKRRKNFEFLLANLEDISLYKKLPKGVCPLGFPIIVNNRNKIKNYLIKNKVYPPIHWPLSEKIQNKFKVSGKISKHILTMPLDHRYNLKDMNRVVDLLKKYVK